MSWRHLSDYDREMQTACCHCGYPDTVPRRGPDGKFRNWCEVCLSRFSEAPIPERELDREPGYTDCQEMFKRLGIDCEGGK
jgi:hypothetical protein